MRSWFIVFVVAIALVACGGSQARQGGRAGANGERSRSLAGANAGDNARCDAEQPNRELSEYDTNGDSEPDVRKVYARIGSGPTAPLILICREADLNGDGTKDVVRYYNDEGRPLREEADRNFDGQMDVVTVFEDGLVMLQEIDENRDGKVDTKIFYDDSEPLRAERDLAGRSTASQWRPDRWEYYENGRMVRMGTDLDGDGIVDRWDRNEQLRRQFEEQRMAAEGGPGVEGTPDEELEPEETATEPDAGVADAGARRRR